MYAEGEDNYNAKVCLKVSMLVRFCVLKWALARKKWVYYIG